MTTIDLNTLPAEIADKIRQQLEDATPAATASELEAAYQYPKFIISGGPLSRDVGTSVQVSSPFDTSGGTITRKLTDDAYLIRIADDLEIVAHEPFCQWSPPVKPKSLRQRRTKKS